MKNHTQDIAWIKMSLARIEGSVSSGFERVGRSLVSLENQNAAICAKQKWHRISLIGIWSAFGSSVMMIIVGVVTYLLKYHHTHP